MSVERVILSSVQAVTQKGCISLHAQQSHYFHNIRHGTEATIRRCGLMDKALVFGTKDCRYESCQGHCSFKAKHLHAKLSHIIT